MEWLMAGPKPDIAVNEAAQRWSQRFGARFVPDSFASLPSALAQRRIVIQKRPARAKAGLPPWKTDADLVLVACDPRRPPAWRRRDCRARSHQHRQDPS